MKPKCKHSKAEDSDFICELTWGGELCMENPETCEDYEEEE